MSTEVKILRLAFHPATPEHEAIAAFLKARRLVPENPNYEGFLQASNNVNNQSIDKNKFTKSWKLTVPTKKIPHIINGFFVFKEEPFYNIDILSKEWTATGSVDIRVRVFFETSNLVHIFDMYFDELINRINRM